jgi:hypothetical protein
MTSGHGWHGQVLNEEVPYHERSVQEIMIEDLQKQVVELTQRLAAQNMEMYRNIDSRDLESNSENPCHNPILVREQRGQDEKFVDEEFQYEEDVEDPCQYFVDWNSPPIYDIYHDEKDLLKEVSFVVDAIKFIEENNDYHVFDESPYNERFQFSNEEISYVDFLGIENFLSNSPSNNLDVGFGVLDENFNFCGKERIDNSLKTFMERELEKINERLEKIDLF